MYRDGFMVMLVIIVLCDVFGREREGKSFKKEDYRNTQEKKLILIARDLKVTNLLHHIIRIYYVDV
jgi:hypothetical protein